MPTTKERILVTLTRDMARDITALAKRENSPRATVAARLMRRALEDMADRKAARIADQRLLTTKEWLTQDEFWDRAEKIRKKGNG